MKFYDRTKELSILKDITTASHNSAQFTVVTGRRRIGKTTLLLKAFEHETMLYFFVARKAEKDLCRSFLHEIEDKLGLPQIGAAEDFASLFEYLMKISADRPFTLVIDEFQDFLRVNPSVFSDIQRIWDLYKEKSKINLVVSGSINRMMTKIFKNKTEPLYNRQDHFLTVRPFDTTVIKEILRDYNPTYTAEDLLALYTFTGGVAKYISILMNAGATTQAKMLDAIVRQDSFFIDEGMALLLEEFGKDYGVYFSILSAIASGHTERAEIENTIGKEIGGYLSKLEDDYALISKKQPIFEKTSNKKVRYHLNDNFLSFWFRFIFKYNHMLQISAFEQLKRIIERDYSVYSGIMLERYFKAKMAESQQYTRIGSWWARKGENEIDIVAENEIDKTALFIEVKKNPAKYNETALLDKINVFNRTAKVFHGYKVEHLMLSLADM